MEKRLLATVTIGIVMLFVANIANAISWSSQTSSTVTAINIGTLGGSTSFGVGINDTGQVTGASRIDDFSPQHAFVWDPITKNMTDLGVVFGGDSTLGWGINNSGQVSGSSANRAFVWDPVTLTVTNLGTLGGNYSTGFQINNFGQVTGAADGNSEMHAFMWDPTTKSMMDLGSLGGNISAGYGINDAGQVTGYLTIAGNSIQHAFVYENGKMYDLNTLVQLATGEYLERSYSINELSQIVAVSNFR